MFATGPVLGMVLYSLASILYSLRLFGISILESWEYHNLNSSIRLLRSDIPSLL